MFASKGYKEPGGSLRNQNASLRNKSVSVTLKKRTGRSEVSGPRLLVFAKKLEKDGPTPFWRKKSLESLFSNVSIALYKKSG